jgi:hypothetical protein
MRKEAIIEETFSVRAVPRLYNEDQLPLRESWDVRRVGGWCEMVASCEDVNLETEEPPLLKVVTKQCSEDSEKDQSFLCEINV